MFYQTGVTQRKMLKDRNASFLEDLNFYFSCLLFCICCALREDWFYQLSHHHKAKIIPYLMFSKIGQPHSFQNV